jgi:hypothetical protein
MKIETISGADFLMVEVENDSRNLNPYRINIGEIRYLRQFVEGDNDAGVAIFVGSKMFTTKESIEDSFSFKYKNGISVKIGNNEFYCVRATTLSEKQSSFYLINLKKVLYTRKFLTNDKHLTGIDKFAVITTDDRIIIIDKI